MISKRNQLGKNNPNWRGGKPKCKCGKTIDYVSIQCKKCAGIKHSKQMKGKLNPFYKKKHTKKTKNKLSELQKKLLRNPKNNPNYKNGKTNNHKCIICGNHCSNKSKKLCRKCYSKTLKGIRKNKIVKHHIYLKENNPETIKLTSSNHLKLHSWAYRYLVEKGLVIKYIKWFFKKRGIIIK